MTHSLGLFTFHTGCTLLFLCVSYCMRCRLIVCSLKNCITKAFPITLINLIVFACGLLTACFAWHNISVYITYLLFSVNELCARPNLLPQHLLHVSLEPPKSPLASIAGYRCEPPIRHQALPACGGDLVGSHSI
jgi:hypothetical protein